MLFLCYFIVFLITTFFISSFFLSFIPSFFRYFLLCSPTNFYFVSSVCSSHSLLTLVFSLSCFLFSSISYIFLSVMFLFNFLCYSFNFPFLVTSIFPSLVHFMSILSFPNRSFIQIQLFPLFSHISSLFLTYVFFLPSLFFLEIDVAVLKVIFRGASCPKIWTSLTFTLRLTLSSAVSE